MEKMNLAVGMKNCFDISGVNKRLVHHFTRMCSRNVLVALYWQFTNGIKGTHIWVRTETSVSNKDEKITQRCLWEDRFTKGRLLSLLS